MTSLLKEWQESGLYFHFSKDYYRFDLKNVKVEEGQLTRIPFNKVIDIKLCSYGLHASEHFICALKYIPMFATRLNIVRLKGIVAADFNKIVAAEREVVRTIPIVSLCDGIIRYFNEVENIDISYHLVSRTTGLHHILENISDYMCFSLNLESDEIDEIILRVIDKMQ